MFAHSVQPPIVSLFSSTGSEPLALWTVSKHAELPEDSVVCLFEDTSSAPAPPEPAKLVASPPIDSDDEHGRGQGRTLSQTVLHIQSPDIRSTYVRCPPTGSLGLKHPWIHLQVRSLGKEWAFEVGIVDRAGREGIVRFSTFQRTPRLKPAELPILHLPVSFPQSSHRLTGWAIINVNLANLLPRFSDVSLLEEEEEEEEDASEDEDYGNQPRPRKKARLAGVVPSGTMSHVSYVKVYATCRLRRLWFSQTGATVDLPWEFELYSAD
ncbi:hypothetical protein PsYK624_110460 [Phanerochaete sordida]|uniref:CFA20 domain-containing protein n=1 Tax=Phanerochaete sordida TaxID=48140 RepID=A0A9P3LH11_9APHY|nr:hypothetical protein PsYK624_110460 [Phanerochaete sordida]